MGITFCAIAALRLASPVVATYRPAARPPHRPRISVHTPCNIDLDQSLFPTYSCGTTAPRPPRNFGRDVGLSYVPRGCLTLKVGNAEIAIARHLRCRSGADVHRRPDCGRARRVASDFSPIIEWRNQISSDLEHNKRYLPENRTRGKIGIVRFELTMNRAG